MTIAEFISLEETARLLESLSGNASEGDWLVDGVEYGVPDLHIRFHRVLTIRLAEKR